MADLWSCFYNYCTLNPDPILCVSLCHLLAAYDASSGIAGGSERPFCVCSLFLQSGMVSRSLWTMQEVSVASSVPCFPLFLFLSPEQSIRDGLLKSLQPSLLFQSFCSRQLFSLLSLRRLPFYVELISFLELCEQSWIYIFPPKCHKGFFFLIIPQDISRPLEKCCKSFIEFFFFFLW